MISFIFRRFLLSLLTLWVLSMISWVIIELPPGDFIDIYIKELAGGMSEEIVLQNTEELERVLREQFGLDKSNLHQIF